LSGEKLTSETPKMAKPIIVILGPTASGKSALALELAAKIRAQILSVDSMQVYRGMNIGTAKPTSEQQRGISHHLIDVVNPQENFSVARFVELADQAIADARNRGTGIIATGGTPMYFKALFQGLFAGPSADESIRARLRQLDGPKLHEMLQAADPAAADRIEPADQRRLIRALEVHELTGQAISALQQQWSADSKPRHEAIWFGLMWDKKSLNRRINARVKEMIAAGWVEEVRQILRDFPDLSKTAAEATGYRELIELISGKIPLEDAVEQIKIATRQLARRQMKWFRRFPNVHWLPGENAVDDNVRKIMQILDDGGHSC
jgi:tRNA dimethylallyltransferase